MTDTLGHIQELASSSSNELYLELRGLAARYMQAQPTDHTLSATALVHEAYLRLQRPTESNRADREHFLAVAALAMRQILVDHARRKHAARRGGYEAKLRLSDEVELTDASDLSFLVLDEALDQLQAYDARKTAVVQMRFFAGMTVTEIARALEISVSTVEADWRFARAWLAARLTEGDPE